MTLNFHVRRFPRMTTYGLTKSTHETFKCRKRPKDLENGHIRQKAQIEFITITISIQTSICTDENPILHPIIHKNWTKQRDRTANTTTLDNVNKLNKNNVCRSDDAVFCVCYSTLLYMSEQQWASTSSDNNKNSNNNNKPYWKLKECTKKVLELPSSLCHDIFFLYFGYTTDILGVFKYNK